MFTTPRKVQQEIQINQTSTSTSANQVEGHIKDSATKILTCSADTCGVNDQSCCNCVIDY